MKSSSAQSQLQDFSDSNNANNNDRPDAANQSLSSAKVVQLRPPSRWHDPLHLIQTRAPSEQGRIVLWVVSLLVLVLLLWAALGQLDMIVSSEGKLVPQTLVKIVQPAEAGVVKQLLVQEGDQVVAGQVLARLDPTVAQAEQAGVASELASARMQVRRVQAELANAPMLPKSGDQPQLYAQVHGQYVAHRQAYLDGISGAASMLQKAEHERKSAAEILSKLEQSLPAYNKAAEAFGKLEKEGFYGGLASGEKQREALEKQKDRDAQKSTVASLDATIAAEKMRISQLQSNYKSELEKELADLRARTAQLQPNLDKSNYKAGLLELKAPQDGTIKDLATTSVGAVVQPGTVVLTLVPKDEQLYADVAIKNEDVGFVRAGQQVQIKLAAYPFQRHGMLGGKIIHISADASEAGKQASSPNAPEPMLASYKARVKLDRQSLLDPQGTPLAIAPGMQVVAEIVQGRQTVLQYLLSPVRKVVSEAGHER